MFEIYLKKIILRKELGTKKFFKVIYVNKNLEKPKDLAIGK